MARTTSSPAHARGRRAVGTDVHMLWAVLACVMLFIFGQAAYAQDADDNAPLGNAGQPCLTNHSLLLVASNQLMTDCGYLGWCDPTTNVCAARGCRRDDYPFGYSTVDRKRWPKKCNDEQFCPDEGSMCMDKVQLGGACQLNRDDECTTSAANPTVRCLHNVCVAANATGGNSCIHENVVYTVFTPDNSSYGSIVSRDNCVGGFYCDSPTTVCLARKAKGAACSADKECMTDFCQDTSYTPAVPDNNDLNGKCSDQPSLILTRHQVWVYPVIVLVALAAVGIFFVMLLKIHQSQGTRRREKQRLYWESQRLINEKARIYKGDVRTFMSQPGTPIRTEDPTRRSTRPQPYSLQPKREGEGSQSSLLGTPSRPDSYDYGTRTPSELSALHAGVSGRQHERQHSGLPSTNDIPAMNHLLSVTSENDLRNVNSALSNATLPSEPAAMYLTPSHSLASLQAGNDTADPFLSEGSQGHGAAAAAAAVDRTRRTSAQQAAANIRNRESVARGGAQGGHGWASPDAHRLSAGQDWSFAVTEDHRDH